MLNAERCSTPAMDNPATFSFQVDDLYFRLQLPQRRISDRKISAGHRIWLNWKLILN